MTESITIKITRKKVFIVLLGTLLVLIAASVFFFITLSVLIGMPSTYYIFGVIMLAISLMGYAALTAE